VTPVTEVRPHTGTAVRPQLGRVRAAGRAARSWRWLRPLLGSLLLVLLVARVGIGPFRAGLARVSPDLVVAALLTTAVSTLCCAWRWRLVAGRLGLAVPPGVAVAAYYRSQLLNATLPGGVAGDLHRAVRHGVGAGGLGLGLRSVGWERVLGQAVQVGLLLAVLLAVPSPLRPRADVVAVAVAGVLVVGSLAVLAGRGDGRLARRFARPVTDDLRRVLGRPRTATAVVLLSTAAAGCHAALFVLATRATGAGESFPVTLVLALLVLVVAAVPTNVAGWGPREGAAAWAFTTVGASAAVGVGAAALYGVLALVGTLPGLVLLLVGRGRLGARAGGRDG
jgi:uncharacterized membrane protein YbhN (UPF0104 family)